VTAARHRNARQPIGPLLAWGFAIAIAVVGVWVALFSRRGDPSLADAAWSPALAVAFTTVGALIVARRPELTVGRLSLAIGLALGLHIAVVAIVAIVDVRPGRLPPVMLGAAVMSSWLQGLGFLLIAALVARFPGGRLPSPRWRVIDALIVAAAVLLPLSSLTPGRLEFPWILQADNPIGLAGVAPDTFVLLGALGGTAGGLAILLSTVALFRTYRRASGPERAQVRWVLAAAVPVVAAVALISVDPEGPLGSVGFAAFLAAPALVPIGIGVAILRYHLYEIDRIVSRSIGYAVVTAVLALVFLTANLVLQAVLAPLVGADTIVVAASTLLIAALFTPVRSRIQRAVDRRFHRARFDAERLASSFADRLRDEVDLDTLRSQTIATAAGAIQPVSAGLWLRAGRPPS